VAVTRTPADVGLSAEDVRLTTADGVELAAWWVPPANGAAVVLAHGAGSTRSSVLDQAEVLVAHGYGVLAVDARGHGDSDGRAMDLGWWGDRDLAAAMDFLAGRPEVDHVAALGLSMGGEEVLGALAADDRLEAVVAEGATVRVADDRAWLSTHYGWRGAVQEWVEEATTWFADRFTAAHPPIALRDAVASAAPRPVLLVTAGEVPDEALAAEWIRDGSPSSVTVVTIDGAGHTAGLRTDPDRWEATVVGFLDDALGVEAER
jgi:pimeloyl-ACP methyl ester carboxylesterase